MKAFEEWEKIEGCPGRKTCLDIHCRDCTGERNRGWKAALELSLRLLQDQYEGGLSAFDTISKELADE